MITSRNLVEINLFAVEGVVMRFKLVFERLLGVGFNQQQAIIPSPLVIPKRPIPTPAQAGGLEVASEL